MKLYLELQCRMIARRLREWGFNPFLAIAFLLASFTGFSIYLFFKAGSLGPCLYLFISLSLTFKLSETGRNDFLKTCFTEKEYFLVRAGENLIVTFPFLLFLIIKGFFLWALILLVLAFVLGLFRFTMTYVITFPTPFYRQPFEFTVGFRNTFYLFAAAYFILVAAIQVKNFNLGIFALLSIFLVALTYYMKPENEYFVWSWNDTPAGFLWRKIKTAWIFVSMLVLPAVVTLSTFYRDEIGIILLATLLGYVYLMTIVLAKYAVYPEEINVIQVGLIAGGLFFPPLLLILIPYFFVQSTRQLKTFLK